MMAGHIVVAIIVTDTVVSWTQWFIFYRECFTVHCCVICKHPAICNTACICHSV